MTLNKSTGEFNKRFVFVLREPRRRKCFKMIPLEAAHAEMLSTVSFEVL